VIGGGDSRPAPILTYYHGQGRGQIAYLPPQQSHYHHTIARATPSLHSTPYIYILN